MIPRDPDLADFLRKEGAVAIILMKTRLWFFTVPPNEYGIACTRHREYIRRNEFNEDYCPQCVEEQVGSFDPKKGLGLLKLLEEQERHWKPAYLKCDRAKSIDLVYIPRPLDNAGRE